MSQQPSSSSPLADGSGGNALRIAGWLALAALVVVLDQWSKDWIVARFALGDSQPVLPFFNLVRVHNPGAAFSFLAGASGWQRWFFTALAAVVSVVIVWMLRKHPGHTLLCFALSMILGGAIGNVIDRLAHGHVIDFIQLHAGGRYFPSFNLADSAITLGAICLIVDELLRMRQARAQQRDQAGR